MNIHQEIEKLFEQRQDIPLFYIESGSRLWGMASPDSDYDVRGFHLPRALLHKAFDGRVFLSC